MGFLGGSDGKEFACNVGDLSLIPGFGRSPGGGHGNPFQYSCLESPHGQRSLAGYSPWGLKESDTTERLHFHFLQPTDFHFYYLQGKCFQAGNRKNAFQKFAKSWSMSFYATGINILISHQQKKTKKTNLKSVDYKGSYFD